jgi:hypothetical protein
MKKVEKGKKKAHLETAPPIHTIRKDRISAIMVSNPGALSTAAQL